MPTEYLWRILVVDDQNAEEVAELIGGTKVVSPPDFVKTITVDKFDEAIPVVEKERIDLIVLDLKDDRGDHGDEAVFPGATVFEEVQKRIFVPVVFHTAYPKHAISSPTPLAKVVTRGNPELLRSAIRDVFETRILHFMRHLEDVKRSYMWDFVNRHWNDFEQEDRVDVGYLLARRLANTLGRESLRGLFTEKQMDGIDPADGSVVHPMELYLYPPLEGVHLAGEIVVHDDSDGKEGEFWLVLTPSCDFANNGKAEHVLLAACGSLENHDAYEKVKKAKLEEKSPSETAKKEFVKLLRGNYGQKDRYKYLPGTYFIRDLVVDFQRIKCVSRHEFEEHRVVAQLDAPFAESVVNQFARFYGRIGTPDLNPEVILKRVGAS